MNIQNCSTSELLTLLVGRQMATKLSKVPLSVLFEMRSNRSIVAESQANYASPSVIA